MTTPTHLEQYSELYEKGGVQFMDFDIDTEFNDSIDGNVLVGIDKYYHYFVQTVSYTKPTMA